MGTTDAFNELKASLAEGESWSQASLRARHIHVYPDFHGNRSPVADPSLRGMMVGLSMGSEAEEQEHATLIAAVLALAYSTRHILETCHTAGLCKTRSLWACGGLVANELYLQAHADVLQIPVFAPASGAGGDAVLFGSAMLGAVAAGLYPDLSQAMRSMAPRVTKVEPCRNLRG